MSNFWPNGIGETVGDDLASETPLYTGGHIWYVNSTGGADAASPAGRNKEKPLATLGQAHTNCASGDIIVLLTGHTESRTSALTITKSITIVGVGTTSGKPSVQLKNNAAATNMWILATAGIQVEVRNVYFPAQTQSCSVGKFAYSAGSLRFVGCYFEANVFDTSVLFILPTSGTDSHFDLLNCTVISTGTSTTSQPLGAINIASITAHVRLDGSIFSDGTYGWSNDAVISMTGAGATETVRGINVSLLNGASISVPAARSWITVGTATGGGRVII